MLEVKKEGIISDETHLEIEDSSMLNFPEVHEDKRSHPDNEIMNQQGPLLIIW